MEWYIDVPLFYIWVKNPEFCLVYQQWHVVVLSSSATTNLFRLPNSAFEYDNRHAFCSVFKFLEHKEQQTAELLRSIYKSMDVFCFKLFQEAQKGAVTLY